MQTLTLQNFKSDNDDSIQTVPVKNSQNYELQNQ